jgi:hypothetical protein
MKKLLIAMLLGLPPMASAEYLDLITFEMTDECSLPEYLGIVSEFNEWGSEYGYQTRIAVPLQSKNLSTYHWLGTTADAATFGKAWDAWRNAQSDPESMPAQLMKRFETCTTRTGRWGFDVFK